MTDGVSIMEHQRGGICPSLFSSSDMIEQYHSMMGILALMVGHHHMI
jgi:hypothetical protein